MTGLVLYGLGMFCVGMAIGVVAVLAFVSVDGPEVAEARENLDELNYLREFYSNLAKMIDNHDHRVG